MKTGNLRPTQIFMSGNGGREGAGRQMWFFRLRSIILHIARFDFGADSPNLKMKFGVPVWS
jgi:hypothetical protein